MQHIDKLVDVPVVIPSLADHGCKRQLRRSQQQQTHQAVHEETEVEKKRMGKRRKNGEGRKSKGKGDTREKKKTRKKRPRKRRIWRRNEEAREEEQRTEEGETNRAQESYGEEKDKAEESTGRCREERKVRRGEIKGVQIVVKVDNSKTYMMDATPSDKVGDTKRKIPNSACYNQRDVCDLRRKEC